MVLLGLTVHRDHNHGLVTLTRLDLERPQLDVSLHNRIGKLAANEPLCIEDGVLWVSGDLVLCSVTDESLSIGKSNITRRGSVSLIVCNDLDTIIFPNPDTPQMFSKKLQRVETHKHTK